LELNKIQDLSGAKKKKEKEKNEVVASPTALPLKTGEVGGK